MVKIWSVVHGQHKSRIWYSPALVQSIRAIPFQGIWHAYFRGSYKEEKDSVISAFPPVFFLMYGGDQ